MASEREQLAGAEALKAIGIVRADVPAMLEEKARLERDRCVHEPEEPTEPFLRVGPMRDGSVLTIHICKHCDALYRAKI